MTLEFRWLVTFINALFLCWMGRMELSLGHSRGWVAIITSGGLLVLLICDVVIERRRRKFGRDEE